MAAPTAPVSAVDAASTPDIPAPAPARGHVAAGFEQVAATFAAQLGRGEETGAGLSVYHRGRHVIDLWGGHADRAAGRSWQRDTRVVVFSVTKGLSAMAFHVLADRGAFDWDGRVADHWPGFAAAGKGDITIRSLLNHSAGLAYLDQKITMEEVTDPSCADAVLRVLENQAPAWAPGSRQAYHAVTWGLYAGELFRRIAKESLGTFLKRELFEPLGSDARLGTPPELEHLQARLYAPSVPRRVASMVSTSVLSPGSAEARIAKQVLLPSSVARRVFANPPSGKRGVLVYDDVPVRRAELAWASATSSADGIARAYRPFANGGEVDGRRYFSAASIEPLTRRQAWSWEDAVLNKPVGWSQGFLKEERHMFCPNATSFGHAGMGGALGWCDPTAGVAFGYVMNEMDWRVRSPRALALCHALYECEPLR